MTDAHHVAKVGRTKHPRAAVLLGLGAFITIVGAIVGLAAKRSADIASYVASQPKAMTSVASNPLALSFDPSSAHYVAPDYTGLWLGIAVVTIGLVIVVAGIIDAVLPRRRRG